MPYYFKNDASSYTLFAYLSDSYATHSLTQLVEELSLKITLHETLRETRTGLDTAIMAITLTADEFKILSSLPEIEPLLLVNTREMESYLVIEAIEDAAGQLRMPYDSSIWPNHVENFTLTQGAQTTHRPNHGIAHSVGVAKNVTALWLLYNRYHPQYFQQGDFTRDKIPLLEMAMMYSVIGRQNEIGWRKLPEFDEIVDQLNLFIKEAALPPLPKQKQYFLGDFKIYIIAKHIANLEKFELDSLHRAKTLIIEKAQNAWIDNHVDFIKNYEPYFQETNESRALFTYIKSIARRYPDGLLDFCYSHYPDMIIDDYIEYQKNPDFYAKQLKYFVTIITELKNKIEAESGLQDASAKNKLETLYKCLTQTLVSEVYTQKLDVFTYSRFRENSANSYRAFCEKIKLHYPVLYQTNEADFQKLHLAIRYMGDPDYKMAIASTRPLFQRYCTFISRIHDADLNRCFNWRVQESLTTILRDIDPTSSDPIAKQDVSDLHMYFTACQEARGERIQERCTAAGDAYAHANAESFGEHFYQTNNSAIIAAAYIDHVKRPFSEEDELYNYRGIQALLPPIHELKKSNDGNTTAILFKDKSILLKWINELKKLPYGLILHRFAMNLIDDDIHEQDGYYYFEISTLIFQSQLEKYINFNMPTLGHTTKEELFSDSDELSILTAISHCNALHKAINIYYDVPKRKYKSDFYFGQLENPSRARPIPRRFTDIPKWKPIYEMHKKKTYRFDPRANLHIAKYGIRDIRGRKKLTTAAKKSAHQLLDPKGRVKYYARFGSFGIVSDIKDLKINYLHKIDHDSLRQTHIPDGDIFEHKKVRWSIPQTLAELQQSLITDQHKYIVPIDIAKDNHSYYQSEHAHSTCWSELAAKPRKIAIKAFTSTLSTPTNRILTALHASHLRVTHGYDLPILILEESGLAKVYTEILFISDLREIQENYLRLTTLISRSLPNYPNCTLNAFLELDVENALHLDIYQKNMLSEMQSVMMHLTHPPYCIDLDIKTFLSTSLDEFIEQVISRTNLLCGVSRAKEIIANHEWEELSEQKKNNFIRKCISLENFYDLMNSKEGQDIFSESVKTITQSHPLPEWCRTVVIYALANEWDNYIPLIDQASLIILFSNNDIASMIAEKNIALITAALQHDIHLEIEHKKNIFLFLTYYLTRSVVESDYENIYDIVKICPELHEIYRDHYLLHDIRQNRSERAEFFLPELDCIKHANIVSEVLRCDNNKLKTILLQIAIKQNRPDTIQSLLVTASFMQEVIADPSFPACYNNLMITSPEIALRWSLKQVDLQWLQLVLPKITDFSKKDLEGRSYAYTAAIHENWAALALLLGHPCFHDNLLCNAEGAEILCLAARSECWDVVNLLLQKNVDITTEVIDANYNTAFTFAVKKNQNSIAKILYPQISELNILNNAFKAAIENENYEMVSLISQHPLLVVNNIERLSIDRHVNNFNEMIKLVLHWLLISNADNQKKENARRILKIILTKNPSIIEKIPHPILAIFLQDSLSREAFINSSIADWLYTKKHFDRLNQDQQDTISEFLSPLILETALAEPTPTIVYIITRISSKNLVNLWETNQAFRTLFKNEEIKLGFILGLMQTERGMTTLLSQQFVPLISFASIFQTPSLAPILLYYFSQSSSGISIIIEHRSIINIKDILKKDDQDDTSPFYFLSKHEEGIELIEHLMNDSSIVPLLPPYITQQIKNQNELGMSVFYHLTKSGKGFHLLSQYPDLITMEALFNQVKSGSERKLSGFYWLFQKDYQLSMLPTALREQVFEGLSETILDSLVEDFIGILHINIEYILKLKNALYFLLIHEINSDEMLRNNLLTYLARLLNSPVETDKIDARHIFKNVFEDFIHLVPAHLLLSSFLLDKETNDFYCESLFTLDSFDLEKYPTIFDDITPEVINFNGSDSPLLSYLADYRKKNIIIKLLNKPHFISALTTESICCKNNKGVSFILYLLSSNEGIDILNKNPEWVRPLVSHFLKIDDEINIFLLSEYAPINKIFQNLFNNHPETIFEIKDLWKEDSSVPIEKRHIFIKTLTNTMVLKFLVTGHRYEKLLHLLKNNPDLATQALCHRFANSGPKDNTSALWSMITSALGRKKFITEFLPIMSVNQDFIACLYEPCTAKGPYLYESIMSLLIKTFDKGGKHILDTFLKYHPQIFTTVTPYSLFKICMDGPNRGVSLLHFLSGTDRGMNLVVTLLNNQAFINKISLEKCAFCVCASNSQNVSLLFYLSSSKAGILLLKKLMQKKPGLLQIIENQYPSACRAATQLLKTSSLTTLLETAPTRSDSTLAAGAYYPSSSEKIILESRQAFFAVNHKKSQHNDLVSLQTSNGGRITKKT